VRSRREWTTFHGSRDGSSVVFLVLIASTLRCVHHRRRVQNAKCMHHAPRKKLAGMQRFVPYVIREQDRIVLYIQNSYVLYVRETTSALRACMHGNSKMADWILVTRFVLSIK
jgi:hypothetical protein